MIIFQGNGGRLGNQIFQVAFIEGIRGKKERVITTQMRDCKRLFLGLGRYHSFQSYFMVKLADKVIYPLLQFFVLRKIMGGLIEGEGDGKYRPGIIPVRFCRGYFQSEVYFKKLPPSCLKIRPRYSMYAHNALKDVGRKTPLFVHVRRGDHGVPGIQGHYNPLLPAGYYRQGIQRLLKEVPDPHFFFVGDDPEWCKREFTDLRVKTVCSGTAQDDIALMMACAGGVASNSTFAWWGAYLCRRTAPIYAPQFWLGWSMNEWHPQSIQTPVFSFLGIPRAG